MQSPTLLMRIAASKLVLGLFVFGVIQIQYPVLYHHHEHFGHTSRIEGGIPLLVELVDFSDLKVQRAAAGALRTLAFKNDENKNQVDGFSLTHRVHYQI